MSFLVSAAATAATTAATVGTAAATAGALGLGATAAAAGAGTAGAVGGLAAGIGAGAATAGALGAGVGAISAAAQGQDVGKGALMGAAGGVATAGVAGGVSAALGPAAVGGTQAAIQGAAQGVGNVAAGAAGGATSAAVGGNDVGKGALVGAGTAAAASAASGLAGGVSAPTGDLATVAGGTPISADPLGSMSNISNTGTVGTGATSVQPTGVMDTAAQGLTNLTGSPITGEGLSAGLKGLGAGAVADYAGTGMVNADEAAKKASQQNAQGAIDFANQNQAGMANLKGLGFGAPSGPLSSLSGIGKATGGLTALAHGGQIPLKDGAYIIPADVVSALGNGSSKAGAEFLRHLMMEVRKEAVNIQGLGAAKKHGA